MVITHLRRLVQTSLAGASFPLQKGMTALLHAVRKGHRDVVAFLLDNGADPLVRDAVGGKLTSVASLIAIGIGTCVEMLNTPFPLICFLQYGSSALILACRNGDPVIITTFLSYPDVNVNVRNHVRSSMLVGC